MAFRTRSLAAAVGLLVGLAAAIATSAPAQATPTVPGTSVAAHHTTLGQPISVTHQQGTVSPATTAPSTSPSASHINRCSPSLENCGILPVCHSGYACAFVGGDPEWEFQFFNYGGYHLSNWFGTGALENHQTLNAAVRTYNLSGTQIRCYPPRAADYSVDWNPVWRINLTSGGC